MRATRLSFGLLFAAFAVGCGSAAEEAMQQADPAGKADGVTPVCVYKNSCSCINPEWWADAYRPRGGGCAATASWCGSDVNCLRNNAGAIWSTSCPSTGHYCPSQAAVPGQPYQPTQSGWTISGAAAVFAENPAADYYSRDENRFNKAYCGSRNYKYTPEMNVQHQGTSGNLGSASWDCADPKFYFGGNTSALSNAGTGKHTLTFDAPNGYVCDSYKVYPESLSTELRNKGTKQCQLDIWTTGTPQPIFAWFYLKQSSVKFIVKGAVVHYKAKNFAEQTKRYTAAQVCSDTSPFNVNPKMSVSQVASGTTRLAWWDCAAPEFHFGATMNGGYADVPIDLAADQNRHAVTFNAPKELKCEQADVLFNSKKLTLGADYFVSQTGKSCVVTVMMPKQIEPMWGKEFAELFIWFRVSKCAGIFGCGW